MSENWCLQCGKTIGLWEEKCPYCGTNQFGENNEYKPNAKSYAMARKALNMNNDNRQKNKNRFTDEERLALGLHPKDEGYKMSLISKILGKR